MQPYITFGGGSLCKSHLYFHNFIVPNEVEREVADVWYYIISWSFLNIYTAGQKCGHTFSFNGFSVFPWLFPFKLLTEGTKAHVLDFRFFKIASLWWMLYTLLAVSPWASRGSHLKWFFNSLEGVPSASEHLLTLLPLRSISLPTISVGFRSGGCGGRVTWGNTPHSPLINRPHTAWRCHLGHWKMNTGPAKHPPDRLAYRCCGCHDASACLQCHQQSTAAHHTSFPILQGDGWTDGSVNLQFLSLLTWIFADWL